MNLFNSIKRSLQGAKWFRRFEVVTVVLLYSIAGMSFFVGAICSDEWVNRAVSTTFVVTVIIVPLFSLAVAFGIQIIALLRESKEREEVCRQEASFLVALDKCRGKSIIRRNFMGHLLDQWNYQMTKLSYGIISAQEDYWSVCTELYDLSKKTVECTSSIPFSHWKNNTELLNYRNDQKAQLIDQGITVNRTFILDNIAPGPEMHAFLDIVSNQINDDFHIYYIDLSQITDPKIQELLSTDFALIDDIVMMIGRQSKTNNSVYYYDFYDLKLSRSFPTEHKSALSLMNNPNAFLGGQKPILHVSKYRKKIQEFPLFNDKTYETHRNAIVPKANTMQGWQT